MGKKAVFSTTFVTSYAGNFLMWGHTKSVTCNVKQMGEF
jgi:hypothetical protein